MAVDIQQFKNFYKNFSIYQLKDFQVDEDEAKKATNTLNDVLIFVLDKSGSMSGSRIENLKKAVIDLTDKVKDGFKNIHYIQFDNNAKEISYEQVRTLVASGGTSFDAANMKMFQCINQHPDGMSFSVIYFTDGEGSVNFNQLKTSLGGLNQKDVVFHTIGFSSESNKKLLIELTQSGSSFGTFKSINSSADIQFDDFAFLFNESKRGNLEFEQGLTYFFSIDSSNQACLFIKDEKESTIKKCVLNNHELKFQLTQKHFSEIADVEERLKLLESFFNFVLLKEIDSNTNKDALGSLFTDYKMFIELQVLDKISQRTSILEAETLNGEYDDLIQTINSYIQEARKANSNFIELKSLTYDKISKQKFSKRLNQRAAKNELKFETNFKKMKEMISNEAATIDALNENDFPDTCYLTQQNYKELLKNHDCLGLCIRMTRGGEVVIVDPNFIKIDEIGYSSFVSLNSMFMALKYCLDRNQTEQEILNLHGGFLKNYQSHFLDGTHRAQYNAMIPLFINPLHWKIARLLLEPLFGYLVTLNIDGYASDQFYTLYFLVFEKIIFDMIENGGVGSEAQKRIYDQVKICCENILHEFYSLKPNVTAFLQDRLKRTKDEWPNLSIYLLYIYLNEEEKAIVKQSIEQFEYAYFEEQLRRYLTKEFKKGEVLELFNVNKILIQDAAQAAFNVDNMEENTEIAVMSGADLVKKVLEKTNIQIFNEQEMLKQDVVDRLKMFFRSFKNHRITKLFNYVFDCETGFFEKFDEQAVALVYQIVTYGRENDKWRFYRNYNKFDNQSTGDVFLREECLSQICEEFRSQFGQLATNFQSKMAEALSNRYINSENYNAFQFCVGEFSFQKTLKLLQDCSDERVEKLFHFIQNSFESKSYESRWKASKKNTCRLFRALYKYERMQNSRKAERKYDRESTFDAIRAYIDHAASNDELITLLKEYEVKNDVSSINVNIVLKYPLSWELLYSTSASLSRAHYLFDFYRFEIDRENGQSVKICDYFRQGNDYSQYSKANPVVKPVGTTRKVKLFEDYTRTMNKKPLTELEKEWISEQLNLKQQNLLFDIEDWQADLTKLKHIAVLDLITDKDDNSTCAAGLMVFEINHSENKLTLLEAALMRTKLTEPYVSGLLAFREAFTYQELLKKITVKPQVLIFDGNGLLHKREFGLASHIGVLENCVTIGFAKKLHLVDSFPYKNLPEFKQYYQPLLKNYQDSCELKTVDGKVLGYGYLSGVDTKDPVFISPGHRITAETSLKVIKMIDDYLNKMKRARESRLLVVLIK